MTILCSFGWLGVKLITVSVDIGFLSISVSEPWGNSVNEKIQEIYGGIHFVFKVKF